MSAVVLDPNPTTPTFNPIELHSINSPENEKKIDDNLKLATKTLESKILQNIIIDLQKSAEEKYDGEIQQNLIESKKLQEKLSTINAFLENVESALTNNPSNKTISLADKTVIEKVNGIMPDPILEKTTWTRSEAEALSRILSRRGETILREAEELSRKLTWALSDQNESVAIFREIIKTITEMLQYTARNQRVS
jgi:hypothetical protein